MALTDMQKMEIVTTLKKLHPKNSQSTEYPKEPITQMMPDGEIPPDNALKSSTPKQEPSKPALPK